MRRELTGEWAYRSAPDTGAAAAVSADAGALTPDQALKAEDARYAAQTARDFAAMERLYADDLVYIHASGAVDGKASFIESQRTKAVVYRAMRRSDVKTRIYGPVAIIAGRGNFDVTVNGEDRTVDVLFHSIWVKRGSDVQFASWHATPAPKTIA